MLSVEIIKSIAPLAKTSIIIKMIETFNANYEKYGINTFDRVTAFISQCAHESMGFTNLREITGYTYKNGKKIGTGKNARYAPFYGRGLIQTTWEENYYKASMHLFGDDRLVKNPDLVLDPVIATLTSMFFWKSKGLNELADKGLFTKITKVINGGLYGLKERLDYLAKAKTALKKKITTNQNVPKPKLP